MLGLLALENNGIGVIASWEKNSKVEWLGTYWGCDET